MPRVKGMLVGDLVGRRALAQTAAALVVTALIDAWLVSRARQGLSAAGFLMPKMHMENVNRYWAYTLAQAFGVSAFVWAWVGTLVGLCTATRQPTWMPFSRATWVSTHRELSWSVIVLTFAHTLLFRWDAMGDTLAGSFIPYMQFYKPGRFDETLGIVAFYLMIALGPTYYLRLRLGTRLWRIAHRFTIAVYALGVWHTFVTGSDVHYRGAMRLALWLLQLPIALALLWRLVRPLRLEEVFLSHLRLFHARWSIGQALQVGLLAGALIALVVVGIMVSAGRTGGEQLPVAVAPP
jgi:hypothetical protein